MSLSMTQRDPHYIRTIFVLFKKELAAYFNSPIAYIFIGAFLMVGNWLFFKNFFLFGQASLRSYFALLPWLFMFLAPALTMRLWAEEKKAGTIEFLLTLPISNGQAVLAKFFGAAVFLALVLGLTVSLPLSIGRLGSLDVGPVVGSYGGAWLLGSAYLALGLFISSLTKNQIIAFILALAGCFLAFIVGESFVVSGLPAWAAPIAQFVGLGQRFANLTRGVVDSRDIIYYLSFIIFFLWLNMQVLAGRKWQ